ncbi:MAG: IS3 family transposase [Pirellulaceae bacterium]
MEERQISKIALAHALHVSRGSLYYVPKRKKKDLELRDCVVTALVDHPGYGYRRIALHLKINKKRAQRVMALFGLRPKYAQKRHRYGRKTSISGVPNRTQGISPIAPNVIWVGDFTELSYGGRKIYLATVIDRYTREVIAWQLGLHHTTRLILDVLEEAERRRGKAPHIFHSDQGSEYTAHACIEWLVSHQILPSHSPKAKPWKNGHQESFYNRFKLEFGKPSRHNTIANLIEAIGRYIHYYNNRRIHSALKMAPRDYYLKEMETWNTEKMPSEGV